jgi:hypothetical protein
MGKDVRSLEITKILEKQWELTIHIGTYSGKHRENQLIV